MTGASMHHEPQGPNSDLRAWGPQLLERLAAVGPVAFKFDQAEADRVLHVTFDDLDAEARYRYLEPAERLDPREALVPRGFAVFPKSGSPSFSVEIDADHLTSNSSRAFQLASTFLARYRELCGEVGQVMLDSFCHAFSNDAKPAVNFQLTNIHLEEGPDGRSITARVSVPYTLPRLDCSGFGAEDGASMAISGSSLKVHITPVNREENRGEISLPSFGTIIFREEAHCSAEFQRDVKVAVEPDGATGWESSCSANHRIGFQTNRLYRLLLSQLQERGGDIPEISAEACRESANTHRGRSSARLERFNAAKAAADRILCEVLAGDSVERSRIAEGDLLLFGNAEDEHRFSMTLFRAAALGSWLGDDAGQDEEDRLIVTTTSGDAVTTVSSSLGPDSRLFRLVERSEIPGGGRGYLRLSSDGSSPITSMLLVTDADRECPEEHAAFNRGESNGYELRLDYDHGRYVLTLQTHDAALLAFSQALTSKAPLAEQLKELDDLEAVEGAPGNCVITRGLKAGIAAAFSLPAYFRVADEAEPVFAELVEAYRALDNFDILALLAKADRTGIPPTSAPA